MSSESDGGGRYASLRSVTRGASVFAVGTGFSKLLGFLFNLVMTRGLGAGLYGVYTYGFTLAMLAVNFADLGSRKATLKFLPQYAESRPTQNRLLGLTYLTAFGGSLLLGTLLYLAAPAITDLTLGDPLLTDVLRVFAVFVVFQTLTETVGSVFQSLELQEYKVLVENVTLQVVRLLVAGIALAVGATLVGVTAAVVVGSALTLVAGVALFLSRTSFRPALGSSRAETREFYDVSLPLTFLDAGRLLYRQVDLLMVGFLLSASTGVGVYRIATVLAGFLRLPLTGFNQLFPPVASRLHASGDRDGLEAVYAQVTRWTFTVALLPAAGAVVYARELLGLFGSAFTAGEAVLLLFVVGELANAAAGPSNYLLMMTGHQYVASANEWVLGVANVALNYLFITRFGLVGAALATVSVLAAVNLVRVVEVWYTEALFPYSPKFLKPLLAGVVAGGVMAALKAPLSGLVLLVVGGLAGTTAFVAVLVALGIEEEDRGFLREFVPAIGE